MFGYIVLQTCGVNEVVKVCGVYQLDVVSWYSPVSTGHFPAADWGQSQALFLPL